LGYSGLGLGYAGLASPWGLGLYSPWYSMGYRYFRDTMSHGRIEHRIACSYIADKSVLVCQRADAGVECEVVANLTTQAPFKNYELFGIGNIWKFNASTPAAFTRYNLYPRLLDNSAWLNHTSAVAGGGKPVNLSLFHSATFVPNYYGFRVTESACYDKLVELIRAVPLTSYENVTVVNSGNGPSRNVSLFGEILIKKIKV
jgi:hypothetical protein